MRRKKVADMSLQEVREFYRALFDEMWSILKDRNQRTCFECGKHLEKNDTTLFCDSLSYLPLCYDCTFLKIKVKETWDRILKVKK